MQARRNGGRSPKCRVIRLLLVHEDRFDANWTYGQLAQSTIPTEVIRSGRLEALSLISDERIDGIFLDLDFSEGAAAELCRRAVATRKPVVGVVCTGDAAGLGAALAAGVTTCYFKRPGVAGIFRRLARNRSLASSSPPAALTAPGPLEPVR